MSSGGARRAWTAARRAFTLIELLVTVAIVAILATIAVFNLSLATDRSLKAADAAGLKVIGSALSNYFFDYNHLPPADREAGPIESHTVEFSEVGNGPAAGGSWDGLPWLLHTRGYLPDSSKMFCTRYLRLYKGGKTIRGENERIHNFRYAYNSTSLASGWNPNALESGASWLVRDLWVAPQSGWYASSFPAYPADYRYPWGEGDAKGTLELALYSDMTVRTVIGGTDRTP